MPSLVCTDMGDHRQLYHHGTEPGHPGQLSLAIRPWAGAMSTGNGYSHHWERNGEF